MTTEQMNRDIAEYLGWGWNERGYYHVTNMGIFYRIRHNYCPDELEFHKDWAVLLPVWQKLRGELTQTKEMYKLRYNIENAIITCDLPTAHKLIYEAIQLIKQ